MATDVSVGDVEIPHLTVSPFSADDTEVTLTVEAPTGGTEPTISTDDLEHSDSGEVRTYTGPAITYDIAGRWVLTWTVAGTGAGSETQEVYVVAPPTAGGPAWTPGRSRVADYVPGRTLVQAAGGNTPARTFDSTTEPRGVQVDRLIADSVAWVTSITGAIDSTLYELASTCAAIRAAWAVELGWPDRSDAVKTVSLGVADRLRQEAERLRTDLVAANAAAGGTTTPMAGAVMPRWAFPDPPAWGDINL